MIIYEAQTTYCRKEIKPVLLCEPSETYKYLKEWVLMEGLDPTREHLIVIGLNNKNYQVFTKVLTIGTSNQTLVKPSDVIREVLLNNCTSFIISHGHPSGMPEPSAADLRVTRSLREACQIMDINFIDHIVLGEVQNDPMGLGYYSFRAAGHL
jgi:DNA repair protein RadC